MNVYLLLAEVGDGCTAGSELLLELLEEVIDGSDVVKVDQHRMIHVLLLRILFNRVRRQVVERH